MSGGLVYRKVFTCVWQDDRFRALSAPRPNARTLWIYLLTGEHTCQIPGLARVGEAALAESLGWSVPAFHRCWREIEGAGLAQADWASRVVWLPNAIRYDPPANPNIVKGWHRPWREIPDCDLKERARIHIESHCAERGPSFVEAFRGICGNGSTNGSANRSRNGLGNQDQDQDQDQEQEQEDPAEVVRVLDMWNETAARSGLPRCRGAAKVRTTIRIRMRSAGWFDALKAALAFLETSPFHRGQNDNRWKANLEWMLRPGKAEELADQAAVAPPTSPVQPTLNGCEDLS
jgi:hypothetical protein